VRAQQLETSQTAPNAVQRLTSGLMVSGDDLRSRSERGSFCHPDPGSGGGLGFWERLSGYPKTQW